jgi:hypothetical protein
MAESQSHKNNKKAPGNHLGAFLFLATSWVFQSRQLA